MFFRQRAVEPADYFHDLTRKTFHVVERVCIHCVRSHAISTGRAADAKVDAVWMQRLVHAKHFSYFQRAVIGQHDAAGADANMPCAGSHMTDQDLRARVCESAHVVMLREPVAM